MVQSKRIKNKKDLKWVVYAVSGVVLMFVVILGIVWWNVEGSKTDLEKRGFEDRGLPVMEIKLNGVTLSEIDGGSKDIKYEGNEAVLYEDGNSIVFDDVEIKGRGNGTWWQEKKPYRLKFKEKENLFGLGKSRKWNLLANAMDDTYLRTEIAVLLERMLEMKSIYDGEFVELYVDGDYRGLYYLTRTVDISKDLLNLRDSKGILVELDSLYGLWEDYYASNKGDLFLIKDVVDDGLKEIAIEDFVSQYNELEDAIKEKDFERIKDLIDVESFAQYYLLSEFSVNPDAYWTSFYMYKDGEDDKIHAGPGWDFDLAFCNRRWGDYWLGDQFYSPRETMVRSQEKEIPKEFFDIVGIEGRHESGLILSHIVFDLMKIPEFQEEVSTIFQDRMSGRKREFINEILKESERISEAAELDNEKWNGWGYKSELFKMIEWIQARYDYFEEVYGKKDAQIIEAV